MARGIFKHLYFLPIALGALWYGWPGGLISASVSAAAHWSLLYPRSADSLTEAVDLLLVGVVAGWLGHRELRKQQQLAQANTELARLNGELRGSIEQVKHNVRLAAAGQLAAGLAHELRNPLASVEGAAEVLAAGNLPLDTQQELLAIIRKEASRISRLLTELIGFARPRPPQLQTVDLAGLIDALKRLIEPQAVRLGVTVQTDLQPGLRPLHADPDQLQQVLLNLTLNALQAMEGNPGGLVIRARNHGQGVRIEVEDEGCGVAEADVEQIFQPFFTTKPQGSGLGLSVAKEIARQHGGELTAKRRLIRGMIFTVTLP